MPGKHLVLYVSELLRNRRVILKNDITMGECDGFTQQGRDDE